MAEWVLLFLVMVVVAGTYLFNQRVYESQSLLVWAGAGLILTIALIVYVFSKVNRTSQPILDRYQIEAEP